MRRIYGSAVLVVIAGVFLLLTGCATDPTRFENRPMCSLDGAEAIINSKWWKFGFSFEIADRDAPYVCAARILDVKPVVPAVRPIYPTR